MDRYYCRFAVNNFVELRSSLYICGIITNSQGIATDLWNSVKRLLVRYDAGHSISTREIRYRLARAFLQSKMSLCLAESSRRTMIGSHDRASVA